MKLLFDENLSPRLVEALELTFPGSQSVGHVGLGGGSDSAIWGYARENGFTIVSKDNDFRQLAFLHGSPPKVIWLAVGNVATREIVHVLQGNADIIQLFMDSPEEALLVLEIARKEG